MTPTWDVRVVVRRTVLALGLLLLVGVTSGLAAFGAGQLTLGGDMHAPLIPAVWDRVEGERTADHYRRLLDGAQGANVTRTVEVFAERDAVQLQLRLELPIEHPFARVVARGELATQPALAVTSVFGELRVGSDAAKFDEVQAMRFTVDAVKRRLTMSVQVSPSRLSGAYWSLGVRYPIDVRPEHDEVVAHLGPGWILRGMDPAPDEATRELARSSRQTLQPPPMALILLGYKTPTSTEPTQPSEVRPAERAHHVTLKQALRIVSDKVALPLLGSLERAVVLAVPMLFLLWLRRRYRGIADFELLGRLVEMLLLVHFALALGLVSRELGTLLALRIWDNAQLVSLLHGLGLRSTYVAIDAGPNAATVALLGVLAPSLLPVELPSSGRRARRWLVVVGGLLAAVAVAGVPAALEGGSITPFVVAFGAIAFSVLASLPLLALLGGLVSLHGTRSWAAATVAAMIATIAATASSLEPYESWVAVVGMTGLTALLGGHLVFRVLRAGSVAIGQIANLPLAEPLRARRVLAYTVLVLLAIPVALSDSTHGYITSPAQLLWFAHRVDDLLPMLLIGGGAAWLYRECRVNLRLSEPARALGVLVIAAVLYDVNSYWLYLPLTFLLGFAVLYHFLVRAPRGWKASLAEMLEGAVPDRPEQLDRLLDLVSAERAHAGFRDKTRQRLVDGEITPEESEKALSERRTQMQELRSRSRVGIYSLRDVALAFGPNRNAWDNALHGSRWALVFSAPWIALGVRDLLQSPSEFDPYPLWSAALTFVSMIMRWGGLGFLLGLFFPYLPGRSGMHKGFFVFLAAMLPLLPQSAILVDAGGWGPILFLAGQTFIVCMLLGLVAFDYVALQRGGLRSWKLVFQVHDVPALGVSISSVLVAIGVTATTLISSQATALVATGIKLLFGETPTPPGPHGG